MCLLFHLHPVIIETFTLNTTSANNHCLVSLLNLNITSSNANQSYNQTQKSKEKISYFTLSNSANASLNSAVCSSVKWSAIFLSGSLWLEQVFYNLWNFQKLIIISSDEVALIMQGTVLSINSAELLFYPQPHNAL